MKCDNIHFFYNMCCVVVYKIFITVKYTFAFYIDVKPSIATNSITLGTYLPKKVNIVYE